MVTLLLLGQAPMLFAQKGMPPKEPTQATVHTNFPQHEDFKEELLNRLKVPSGFQVSVAATGLGKPRMLCPLPDGGLYVTRRDQGDVLLLRDTDGNGRFDNMQTVLTQFKGVHGITLYDGFLYLCSNRELKRARVKPDGTLDSAKTLIKDLPDGGQHGNRTMAFGPDGWLYVSIGSTCNDCNETNAESATMLRFHADGTGRMIYAKGLRNTIGFDWHPQTKELWGADNGTDWRGEEIPPEELNKIVRDGDYGWPLVYGKQAIDKTREEPPGSTKVAYAKTTVPSVMEFPAHGAPINLIFLQQAKSFPADFQDDALISFHGSWNRQKPDGFKIVRIMYENGQPTGQGDFLTGFLSADGKTRFGRPAGLAVSPQGVLFISDDANGVIYRVTTK